MISVLYNVPQSPEEWAWWSGNHRIDHDEIRGAIQTNNGINLPAYQLDPIPPTRVQQWLVWNQQAHDDMLGVLGLQGTDLEGVDLSNQRQLQAWIWLHVRDHVSARKALGI